MRKSSREIAHLSIVLVAVVMASGCAQLMGSLRGDLDDGQPSDPGPTVGGNWTEAGLLSDNGSNPGDSRYAAVGHTDRNPASDQYGGTAGRDSWLSPSNLENNRRDLNRGAQDADRAVAFSNTPSVVPTTRRLYKNGSRATRDDFVDEAQNEGSLWAADGQSNYFFSKNKIRGVGDIVTITMDQTMVNDAAAEITRTLSPTEKAGEIALAQARMDSRAPASDSVATTAAAPAKPGTSPLDAPPPPKAIGGHCSSGCGGKNDGTAGGKATAADIDVLQSLNLKAGDTIMGEIAERYPNGNYKVRGTKKVRYNNGNRYVNLLGISKGTDISEDDKIDSGKLYEYKLEAVR